MMDCAWCGSATFERITVREAYGKGRRAKLPQNEPCCARCARRIASSDASTSDLLPGKQLDIYEVLSLIAKGAA